MGLMSRILGGSQSQPESDDYGVQQEDQMNMAEVVSGGESVRFSCYGTGDDSRSWVKITDSAIIVSGENRGVYASVDDCAIEFGRYAGRVFINLSAENKGVGVHLAQDDFEEFWRVLSEVRNRTRQD